MLFRKCFLELVSCSYFKRHPIFLHAQRPTVATVAHAVFAVGEVRALEQYLYHAAVLQRKAV